MTTTALVPTDIDARAAEVERQVAEATSRAEAMEVRSQPEAERAAQLLREIAKRGKAAEAERVELTKPLLETKRKIDQRFKDAMAPFAAADKIVRDKLGIYTAEQERLRREEEARLEAERQERERIARGAREKQEAEARAAAEKAAADHREAEELRRQAKDEEDRRVAEALALEAQEKAAEAATAEAAISSLPEVSLPKATIAAPAKPTGISTRKVWKHTVTDPDAVPREYLVVDEKAIRQAVREGIREIPGVRIEQVDSLAVRS